MNEDTVIELAKQSGFLPDVGIPVHPSNLFKFAALVAAAEREEVRRLYRENQFLKHDLYDCAKACEQIAAAEREECAKVADSMASENEIGQFVLKDCAAAIRSRT